MDRKPEIEYVGKFYVYGSEARELAQKTNPKKAKTILPLERLRSIQKVYVDPVALLGITVAVVMVVVMIIGACNIQDAWNEYERMQNYVADLEYDNIKLERDYRNGYNLADVEAAAISMGMIPIEEAQTIRLTVMLPVVEEEPSAWEEFCDYIQWFIDGLFA